MKKSKINAKLKDKLINLGEKMIKKKLIGFLFGVFSLSLFSSASATELKLATFEPPKAFIASKILGAWAEKVNTCANGKLNVKMYAGGVLGSPPKQYDIVTKGVADISWTVLGYIGGQFPLSSVIELPFLTRTSAAGSTALNTLYDETCPGYDFAYFNNQCSLDPQYDIDCPGYIEPEEEIQSPIEPIDSPTIIALATPVILVPVEPVIEIIPEIEIVEVIEPIEQEIEININNAGKSEILISDDGDGISKNDLKKSVERHATSKLSDDDF